MDENTINRINALLGNIASDKHSNYSRQLSRGQIYQDLIITYLSQRGINIAIYTSPIFQLGIGESANGYEIKFDSRMHQTGNVYVEYKEYSFTLKKWVWSGVKKNDNTKYWVIGDTQEVIIVKKKKLLALARAWARQFPASLKYTETSKGVVIPIYKVKEIADHVFDVSEFFQKINFN